MITDELNVYYVKTIIQIEFAPYKIERFFREKLLILHNMNKENHH